MTATFEPMPTDPSVAAAAKGAAPAFLTVGTGADARRIAYILDIRGGPGLLWLGGYGSDMRGGKAEHLSTLAAEDGITYCRFDYSGHGESSGSFEDGTITRWTDEAEAIARTIPNERLVLAGSSMGAWVALRLIQRLRASGAGGRVGGLVLVAPAPDFTRRLVEPRLSAEQRRDLEEKGFASEPSPYSDRPTIYTKALLDDGADNLVMDGLVETGCPVHILQGMADREVPYSHALDLVARMPADGVALTLVPGGDHRLSRPEDLQRLCDAVRTMTSA